MTIETITDYIALYGPSVAQVVSLIAALVFFIKNIKSLVSQNKANSDDVLAQLSKLETQQHAEMMAVLKENAELKKQNKEIKQLITKVQERENVVQPEVTKFTHKADPN